MTRSRGFSLVEVLVALAVVAIALVALLAAAARMARDADRDLAASVPPPVQPIPAMPPQPAFMPPRERSFRRGFGLGAGAFDFRLESLGLGLIARGVGGGRGFHFGSRAFQFFLQALRFAGLARGGISGRGGSGFGLGLAGSIAETVVVDDPASGCAASLRVAVERVDPASAGIVLLLGDQPGVTEVTVRRLIEAGVGESIAVCRYDDGIGHPFWLARGVRRPICTSTGLMVTSGRAPAVAADDADQLGGGGHEPQGRQAHVLAEDVLVGVERRALGHQLAQDALELPQLMTTDSRRQRRHGVRHVGASQAVRTPRALAQAAHLRQVRTARGRGALDHALQDAL